MAEEQERPQRPMGAGLVTSVDWLRRIGSEAANATIAGLEMVRDVSNSAGAAPLHAAFRLGLKELQDNIGVMSPGQGRDEPGSIANPTSQLVTEQMNGNEVDLSTDRITPSTDADIRKAVLGNIPQTQTPAIGQEQERGRGR